MKAYVWHRSCERGRHRSASWCSASTPTPSTHWRFSTRGPPAALTCSRSASRIWTSSSRQSASTWLKSGNPKGRDETQTALDERRADLLGLRGAAQRREGCLAENGL